MDNNSIKMNKNKSVYTQKEVEELLFPTSKDKKDFQRFYENFVKESRAELLQELGEKIRNARKDAGVTQKELAKRLQTKRTAISRIESGRQNLTVESLIKIASTLGGTIEIELSR